MWSKDTTNSLTILYRPLIKLLNGIAMATVAAMMFLTATDVILRYIFNRPISGAYELIEYLMAILIPFGLAYCALQGGHVSVDLLVSRFPKKIQSIIGSVTALFCLVLFALITWQNVIYIGENFESKLTSAVLLIPVYPFIAAVAIGSAALCLVLALDFLNYLIKAVEK